MKIALCFAGQPRDVAGCHSSILTNLIIPNNITDIFFHTWWQPRFEADGYNVGDGTVIGKIQKDSLDLIKTLYKPKKIIIEDDTTKKFHDEKSIISSIIPLALTKTVFPIFYSRYYSNFLKNQYSGENDIEYDAVILTRTDLFIKNKIKINEMDLNFMNTSKYLNRPFDPMLIGDTILISNQQNMDVYADIYDNLPLISTKLKEFDIHNILGKWFMTNDVSVNESMRYPNDVVIYRTK